MTTTTIDELELGDKVVIQTGKKSMRAIMITKTEDGALLVVLSKRFYDKPAVLRAAYKLSNLCTIGMHPKGTD